MKRMQGVAKIEVLRPESLFGNPEKISSAAYILQTWDPNHFVKITVALPMSINVLQSLGTDRHQELINQTLDGQVRNLKICILRRFHPFQTFNTNVTSQVEFAPVGPIYDERYLLGCSRARCSNEGLCR